MSKAKEFFEKLSADEAFAQEVDAELKAAREAGASSYKETIIPVAAKHGYEISEDELEAMIEAQEGALSEEDLGKVAGGTSCIHYVMSAIVVTLVSVTITDGGGA